MPRGLRADGESALMTPLAGAIAKFMIARVRRVSPSRVQQLRGILSLVSVPGDKIGRAKLDAAFATFTMMSV